MKPYDPAELGRHDTALDDVARELERQAAVMAGEPPLELTGRILTAIDEEPMPTSRWAWLSSLRGPARLVAAAAIMVVAVTGAIAIGSLIDAARPDVGGEPTPVVIPSPSMTASPSESPSPVPSPSESAVPSATPSASPEPTTRPTPSDDDELETPEPSESDDDNSGPGGGGGDNSGPGGGDD